jgi:hypothetical protein
MKAAIEYEPINLYHSGSPTESLIHEIQEWLAECGQYLYRYRTASRRCAHIQTITYAVHSGPIRPRRSADCDGISCVIGQDEGRTRNCESFRELSEMFNTLRNEA